jgi:hypothetical protein
VNRPTEFGPEAHIVKASSAAAALRSSVAHFGRRTNAGGWTPMCGVYPGEWRPLEPDEFPHYRTCERCRYQAPDAPVLEGGQAPQRGGGPMSHPLQWSRAEIGWAPDGGYRITIPHWLESRATSELDERLKNALRKAGATGWHVGELKHGEMTRTGGGANFDPGWVVFVGESLAEIDPVALREAVNAAALEASQVAARLDADAQAHADRIFDVWREAG